MNMCYLVGAGEFYHPPMPDPSDLVIAADGGYNSLISHGVRCDLLVGDLDSIQGSPSGLDTLTFPVRKDETDMHLAYLEGVKRGYTQFTILGGAGGSPDHTFANLSLLLYGAKRGHRITLVDKNAVSEVISNAEITYCGECGKRISIFAFGGDAVGVSIEGLEYEARNISLNTEFPLGVSNAFRDTECRISVKKGALLIIREI